MENTNSGQVEIILFYTTGCESCKAYMPIFDRAVLEMGPGVSVRKIDIDKDSSLNSQYNLTAVPTTLAVKNGEVLERHIGPMLTKKLKNLATI